MIKAEWLATVNAEGQTSAGKRTWIPELLFRVHGRAVLDVRGRLEQWLREEALVREEDGGRALGSERVNQDEWLRKLLEIANKDRWSRILKWKCGEERPDRDMLEFASTLATQSYTHETAFRLLDKHPARGIAFVRDRSRQAMVLMARRDLHQVEMPDSMFHSTEPGHETPAFETIHNLSRTRISLSTFPDQPVLRHLRTIPASRDTGLALAGTCDGKVWLQDVVGNTEYVTGPEGAVCRGSASLGFDSNGAFRFIVGWVRRRRCFLEVQEGTIEREEGDDRIALKRLLLQPIDMAIIGDLDAVEESDNRFKVAIGDSAAGEVHLWTLDLSSKVLQPEDKALVDSGVTAVRFAESGEDLLLLAGTRSGFLWCLNGDKLDVAWTYRSQGPVRSLDIRKESHGLRILVATASNHVLILDKDGTRICHHRFGRGVRVARFLPTRSEGPTHIVVTGTGGIVAILRCTESDDSASRLTETSMSVLNEWKAENSVEAGTPLDERIRAVLAVKANDLVQLFHTVKSRPIRCFLARMIVQTGADLNTDVRKRVVTRASFVEIAEMFNWLPEGDLGRWAWLLLDHLIQTRSEKSTVSNSPRARRAALAKGLRRIARERPRPNLLASRLQRLNSDDLSDNWVRIEASRAWTAAVAGSGGDGRQLESTLLDAIHLTPPDLVDGLRFLLRPPEKWSWLILLGEYARAARQDVPIDAEAITKLSNALLDVPSAPRLPAVLGLLVGFLADQSADDGEKWRAFIELSAAARDLPEKPDGVFRRLVRMVGTHVDKALPKETDPLANQVRWLNSALDHPVVFPKRDQADPWDRLALALSDQLNSAIHDTVRARLAFVERLVRPRVQLFSARRPSSNIVELVVDLHPEGSGTRKDVTILLEAVSGGGLRTLGGQHRKRVSRYTYREGMQPDRVKMRCIVDADADKGQLQVRILSAREAQYDCVWTVKIPVANVISVSADSPYPEALSATFRRLSSRLLEFTNGVAVVSHDPSAEPAPFLHALKQEAGVLEVDLDGLLVDLGPGRKFERSLTAENLLRALSGKSITTDPEQMSDVKGTAFSLQGVRQVIINNASESLARLFEPGLTDVLTVLAERMEEHARQKAKPSFLWFLPGEWAGRLRSMLGDAVGFIVLSRIRVRAMNEGGVVEAEEAELVDWMMRRTILTSELAAGHVKWAGGDLRVLEGHLSEWKVRMTRIKLKPEQLQAAAQQDLQALPAQDAFGLMVLAHARTSVRLNDIRKGMTLDQRVESTARTKGRGKELAGSGAVLDAVLLNRIRSDQHPPVRLLIRGVWGKDSFTPNANVRILTSLIPEKADLIRRLIRGGFGASDGGMFRVFPLYANAVDAAVTDSATLQDAFQRLTGRTSLLDGVPLERLQAIDKETSSFLAEGPGGGEDKRMLFLDVGFLWSHPEEGRGPPPLSRCVQLADRFSDSQLLGFRAGDGPPVTYEQEKNPAAWSLLSALDTSRFTLVGMEPIGDLGLHRYFLAFTASSAQPDYDKIQGSLNRDTKGPKPLLIYLGPGVAGWPLPSRGSNQVVLREQDLRAVLGARGPRRAFWAAIRAHTGLEKLMPFHHVGALPSGSPMFVGRSEVISEILRHLTERNFLLLGSRQIGKTSVLFQILGEAKKREDVVAFFLDFMAVDSSAKALGRVRSLLAENRVKPENSSSASDMMRALCIWAKYKKKIPLFFINEIQGVVVNDPGFVEELRSLWDSHGARFVMTAYPEVGRYLRDSNSALYHMTSGPGGEKAFLLGALPEHEALELVDKLELEPLELRWRSPEDQVRGRQLILRYTYSVPWVIQDLCARLVRRLDEDHRSVLTEDDVQSLADTVHPLLDFLDALDFSPHLPGVPRQIVPMTARLILTALARERYFGSDKPIEDPSLQAQAPGHYGFTGFEAMEILSKVFREDAGGEDDVRNLTTFFQGIDLEGFFRGLSLTLIMAPVRGRMARGGPTFCFQSHIYPLELRRAGQRGQPVEDRLVELLLGLIEALRTVGDK